MQDSKVALKETWIARQVVRNAPFAVKASNAIGWLDLILHTTYRGTVTAGQYNDRQKEAQEATKQAEEMWRKALEDFEAWLKQAELCLEESRAAAADRERLERAKAAIEEWDNNQALYRDPISNETVTYREAVRRANEYLKSGRISRNFYSIQPYTLAFFAVGDDPSQAALAAAIRELDKAIPALERMNVSITRYLRAQIVIERKLEEAFGVTGSSTAATPGISQPEVKKKPQ
jgi:hypothetical protein